MTFLIVCWLRLTCDPGVGWSLTGTSAEAWEVAHRVEYLAQDDSMRCGVYDPAANRTLVSEVPLQLTLEDEKPAPAPKKGRHR